LKLLSHAASHVALEGQQETLESMRKPPHTAASISQTLPHVQERAIADTYGVEVIPGGSMDSSTDENTPESQSDERPTLLVG
jgi:hypothetical protein